MEDRELLDHATNKFIELANELKNDGANIQLVSAALMAASGVYATYSVAGNAGALQPSGIDKVVAAYRRNLEHIQERKKEDIQSGTA